MIEELPLLYNDWKWDWTKSNGYASADQTQTAYDALVNKGLCADFSRLVWNDLVDMTAEAINIAGLTWDSTYGKSSDCKITESMGSLTAAAFNAVAQNIHQFGFVTWKWAKNSSTPGYVGRNAFRGYSLYKDNSDFLYGWYIIELAKKLNLMLAVLQDKADFTELESVTQVLSYQDAKLVADPAAVLEHSGVIRSIDASLLAIAKILEASSYTAGYSYSDGVLLVRPPVILESATQAVTISDTEADRLHTQALEHAGYSRTITYAVLTDLVFVAYLKHYGYSRTRSVAELEISNMRELEALQMIKSYSSAKLIAVAVWLLESKQYARSYDSAELLKVERLLLQAMSHSDSYDFAEAALMDRVLLSSAGLVKSYTKATLQYMIPLYLKAIIYSLSYTKAKATAVAAVSAIAESFSESYSDAVLTACQALSIEYADKSETLDLAEIHACQIRLLESFTFGKSFDDSAIICCDVIRLEAYSESRSISRAEAEKGLPLYLEAAGYAQTKELAYLNRLPVKRLESYGYVQTKSKAEIKVAEAVTLSHSGVSWTKDSSVLEIEPVTKDLWKDPIRTGNDLFIRSVHPQWQEGTTVHLDSGGVFYDAVQTGNDVFIRSLDSLKGDEFDG